ncbi:unnamed protein product, partial [Schistocephalus solidus]|uniref:DUF5872 domain-containing protein n=1 Tax=Schistocephalus solidus TaxID=70667 RepID=A0A183TJY8_SCHSO
GQVRRYRDTRKTSPKQLQLNPAKWEDLAQNRPAWRRTAKTGAAIYKDNRIATAKAKRTARKSQEPRTTTAAWLTIFGRNATTTKQHQLLRQRTSPLPTLHRTTLRPTSQCARICGIGGCKSME